MEIKHCYKMNSFQKEHYFEICEINKIYEPFQYLINLMEINILKSVVSKRRHFHKKTRSENWIIYK